MADGDFGPTKAGETFSVTVEVGCQFCPETTSHTIDVPAGWRVPGGTIYEEECFCPDHAGVEAFLRDQCPGCVARFPDCGLGRSFMYSARRTFDASERDLILAGRCPHRVNGTFTLSGGSVESVDLSYISESGAAMVSCIDDYIARYPSAPSASQEDPE